MFYKFWQKRVCVLLHLCFPQKKKKHTHNIFWKTDIRCIVDCCLLRYISRFRSQTARSPQERKRAQKESDANDFWWAKKSSQKDVEKSDPYNKDRGLVIL